ncbi:hypothetical protein D3C81_1191920 [compost metagenome]
MLVALVDVVDQAFVQGPGVNLTFPVVDDGVAEAEHFALQVRHTGSDPGGLGGVQGFIVGLGEEGIDGGLQGLGGAQRVAVDGMDHVGVMLDHGFCRCLVDGASGGRCGSRGGGSRGLRCGGLVLVLAVAATGERDGNGQQTGGGQRHTNHGEFLRREVGQAYRGTQNCNIMRKICILCKGAVT